ncbi:MAG TPA: site-specific DNA-methyltransferase [Nitrospirota bacterium]|nr:site-specific DNA-methyltransferase [Nitrospirota bacterium]
MDKLKMQSPNLVESNIDKISLLFPHCITESRGENGRIKKIVDFDLLRQELSPNLEEGAQERYTLTWPGKNESILAANAPIAKTLRPYESESVNFQDTKNIFIEGDNLDALKLLQENYLNRIKLIYIDPPYNTGNDFIFKDNFEQEVEEYFRKSNQIDEHGNRLEANMSSNGRFHSDWLSMMHSRLRVAKNLLSDDGVLIISIDENEHANLIKICGLVFGDDNFCGEIVWKNSSKNDQDYISIQHEYFVFFVKSKQFNKGNWVEKKAGLDQIYAAFAALKKEHGNDWEAIHKAAVEWYKQFPESNPIVDSKHYSWMDERGIYFPSDISGPNDGQYVYDVYHPVTGKACKMPASGWRYPEETMLERIRDGRIHFGKDHQSIPNNKTYLRDTEFQSLTSLRFVDGRAASKRLQVLFGEKIFTNPKDEILLKDLFKAIGIKASDIVLDFFAGSAATIHAVFELNKEQGSACRTILIQMPEDLNVMYKTATGSAKKVTKNAIDYLKRKKLPENVAEIAKERIRLIGNRIFGSWTGDKGVRVFKVDTSNMADVYYTPDALKQDKLSLFKNNIKSDRNQMDLLIQIMLDWGLDLSLPINEEIIDDKTIYIVDTNALVACFGSNITEEFVKKIAKHKPLRVVFRDDAYINDSVKINVEQIFKLLSPGTEVKSI